MNTDDIFNLSKLIKPSQFSRAILAHELSLLPAWQREMLVPMIEAVQAAHGQNATEEQFSFFAAQVWQALV